MMFDQFVQLPASAKSAQSATNSMAFPTMSNTPQLDLQLLRDPVLTGPGEFVAHVVAPSSAAPGSGVPAAAPCHSTFVSSRFPQSRHAWFAWNHVMHRLGCTPGMGGA